MEQVMEIEIVNRMNTKESGLHCRVCPGCGTPVEHVIDIMGRKIKVAALCKCQSEAYRKRIEEDENKEKIKRLEKFRRYSLMDNNFTECTFENWKLDDENRKWYRLAKNYCDNWYKIKTENVGMLIWGPPGTGKTYLSFCIANKLINEFVPVIATSSIAIINKIYESYSKYGEEGEVEIINSLQNASLLIIDDLGAEHNGRTGKEKQILYSIIDGRMRSGKPLIVTTNLNPNQLKEKLTTDDGITRTFDRLIETCPPIEFKGTSKRIEHAKKKIEIIKSLLD